MARELYLFEALLYPCGDQWEVYVPDIDAYTQGSDLADAAYMAQDLIETWVSMLVTEGKPVPASSFGRPVPEGGHAMIVATDGLTPEVPDMSVAEAADILGVSPSRVYALCRQGKLESRKVGSAVRISTASVKRRFNEPSPAGRPKRELLAA